MQLLPTHTAYRGPIRSRSNSDARGGAHLSRFLHYTVVLVLFGVSFFPIYAYPSCAGSARLGLWIYPTLMGAALVALVSSILWLTATTANMMGAPSAAANWDALSSVVRDTAFGHVWFLRVGLSILILCIVGLRVAPRADGRRDLVIPLLAGLLLTSLAGVGHTRLRRARRHSFIPGPTPFICWQQVPGLVDWWG